jgi:nucleolar MIF4G domain-containing protein 1
LKEIIIRIQERVNILKKEQKKEFDTRITFMLDRIYDLKNNKQKANDTDSSLPLAQKFIKNFLSKNSGAGGGQLLRVGLTDLLEASQKGRWWIVGAAWKSDTPAITPEAAGVAGNQQLLGREAKNET